MMTARCETLADCIDNAGEGRCAIDCVVVEGQGYKECTFLEGCQNDCCKYSPGNTGGNICSKGCGANSVCLSVRPGSCMQQVQYVGICEANTPDFCQCLIRDKLENGNSGDGCCNSDPLMPTDLSQVAACPRTLP